MRMRQGLLAGMILLLFLSGCLQWMESRPTPSAQGAMIPSLAPAEPIFFYDLQTLQVFRLVEKASAYRKDIYSLALSPDKEQLAYITEKNQVFVMDSDGTHPTLLASNIAVGFRVPTLTWSPVGESVLVSDGCRLKQIWIRGNQSQYLTGLPEETCYLFGAIQPNP